MKNTKTILIIAACILISVFSLYFQFVADDEDSASLSPEKDAVELESDASTDNAVPEKSVENPEEERFGQNYGWSVYFSNMDSIYMDDTFLPYQAYADLTGATESFLAEEMELEEGKDYELCLNPEMTYKKGNLISFHCYFAEPEVADGQELEFVYDDQKLEYIDIHFTEKGEWEIPWRN